MILLRSIQSYKVYQLLIVKTQIRRKLLVNLHKKFIYLAGKKQTDAVRSPKAKNSSVFQFLPYDYSSKL